MVKSCVLQLETYAHRIGLLNKVSDVRLRSDKIDSKADDGGRLSAKPLPPATFRAEKLPNARRPSGKLTPLNAQV